MRHFIVHTRRAGQLVTRPLNCGVRPQFRLTTQKMPNLILESFSDESRTYSFDTDRGVWESNRSPKVGENGRVGTSGFADERRVGLLKFDTVFVAVFALGDSVQLQLDQNRLELRSDNVRTYRKWVAPFVKRFAVSDGTGEKFSVNYWWADVHEWPGDDVLDIFLYINRELGSAEQIGSFRYFWSLKTAGLNTMEAARKRDALNRSANASAA